MKLLLSVLACASACAVEGAVSFTTEFSSWQSEVGTVPPVAVDFNEFSETWKLPATAVDFGGIRITAPTMADSGFDPFYNKIVAVPTPAPTDFGVDGTAYLSATFDGRNKALTFVFEQPIYGFAATFARTFYTFSYYDFTKNELRVYSPDGTLLAASPNTISDASFLGFLSTDAVGHIELGLNDEAYPLSGVTLWLDNVIIVPVPEPSIASTAAGLLAVALACYCRMQRNLGPVESKR